MRNKVLLLCAGLLLSAGAWAEDATVTKEEFDAIVAKPFKATHMRKPGVVVHVHLKTDGVATVSEGQRDSGAWRRNGDAGYCVRWDQQPTQDRCIQFLKRDGKLAATAPSGDVVWWIESLP